MKIIVDSACDLPLSYLEENQVEILPLFVIMEDKEYVDMYEITNEKIYDFIKEGKHPRTSQVSLEKFYTCFHHLAIQNESSIYIALSSELSGTYQTAMIAYNQIKEQFPDWDLRIIDSQNASLGIALMVREAVEMLENGFSLDEIEQRVRFMVDHTVSLFTVQDLNYLAEGGRLSKSGAFLGSLLNIHPLLQVVDGKLIPQEKFRGRKRVLNRMYERLEKEADQLKEQTILIVHTNDHEAVQEIKEYITQNMKPAEIIDYPIGAVISAHTGMGTIGIFYLNQFE